MAELFSRYASGLQFTAGAMTGSVSGVSGINPIVDRLNSISTSDNLITGSVVSGTDTVVNMNTGTMTGSPSNAADITTKNYVDNNQLTLVAGEGIDITNGSQISGEDATFTNKGIAKFPDADFDISSGEVTLNADVIKDITTDSGALTPTNHTISILGGEGMNVTHSSTTITVAGENSTAANKGIVIVAGGEGMDVSYSAGTATIAGEDASTTNKGIANFNSNHFTTSTGTVSSRVSAGEGIDVSATQVISGEDATTSNKGIASFNSDDFSASSGAVSLKNKTSFWSTAGVSFKPGDSTEAYNTTSGRYLSDSAQNAFVEVNLPHGAVVTAAIVYGADTESWLLSRIPIDNANSDIAMASAQFGTEDTSITSPIIDNENFAYYMRIVSMEDTDHIDGARITYTTDYI